MADNWDDTLSEYGPTACLWALKNGTHPRLYAERKAAPGQGSLFNQIEGRSAETVEAPKPGPPIWPYLTRRAADGEWYVAQNGRTVAQGFDNEYEAKQWIKEQTK